MPSDLSGSLNPLIGTVHDIVKSFKNTLFSKEPEELEKWLEKAEGLGIEQISSFAGGIRREINAARKAIELDYNNGLAEGSVNKIKVVKRIMYGRNSFELLKGKLLRLELRHKINNFGKNLKFLVISVNQIIIHTSEGKTK